MDQPFILCGLGRLGWRVLDYLLAAGLPVVATDVGGNPEALEGMPDCVLVRAQDPDDLARGLKSAIDRLADPVNGSELRRQLVRVRYSVDAMVDAYERLYDSRQREKNG